jgi:PKD repeat protein
LQIIECKFRQIQIPTNESPFMMRSTITLLLFLSCWSLFGQSRLIEGKEIKKVFSSETLSKELKAWQVFEVDAKSLAEHVRSRDLAQLEWQLGESYSWTMSLWSSEILSPDYVLRAQGEERETRRHGPKNVAFRGELPSVEGSKVRLTLDDGFIYGFVERPDEPLVFIEPLQYFLEEEVPQNYFIAYSEADVIEQKNAKCGLGEMHHHQERMHQEMEQRKKEGEPEMTGNCWEVDLAIASDFLMYQAYNNSVANVENHTIGVMNNVQTNYDDEFADEIQFVIVEQFVSTCSSCDPWTSSTDASTLLNSFTNWGPTGFNQTHDLGQLWTDRDFNGGTVGIAWLFAVCGSSRYHCIQDWTTNASLLRVTTSHEIGHNFSCFHDTGANVWIMSPVVNNTNNWSSTSVNAVNNYVANLTSGGGNCLSNCGQLLPPIANFSAVLTDLCVGSSTAFFDLSENDPSSWNWSFPGGSPSSSTDPNPIITYNLPGTYPVTLTVGNPAGTDVAFFSSFITVGPSGEDLLLYEDFEDGFGNWTVDNPDNGLTWEVIDVEGTEHGESAARMRNFTYGNSNIGQRDAIISPVFDLVGREFARLELDYAYARYNNTFKDSLNIYLSLDGGNTFPIKVFGDTENGTGNFATHPQTTSEFVPEELDDWCFAGSFGNDCLWIDLSAYGGESSVAIKLENVSGYGNNMYLDNIRVISSCEVPPPVAAFVASPQIGCAPLSVNFIDLSIGNPTDWEWTMPGADPSTSDEQSPTVIYFNQGTFDASLTVSNVGGSNTAFIPSYVTVLDVPTPGFIWSEADGTVAFTNQSSGATQYSWDFGDGETSSEVNPIHNYDEDGTYTVTLVAINDCGATTYQEVITIITVPDAGFSASPTSGCAPLTVQFTDESSDNVTSWQWSFPGGTPSSSVDPNPEITYANPGTYDVTLTVINSAGNSTLIENDLITVSEPPTAAFTDSIMVDTVFFMDQSSQADSLFWDFGDGTTSTETDPVHVYAKDSIYTVTLIAISPGCGSDTTTAEIIISSFPIAGFSADTTVGCIPFTVQFANQSTSNTDSLQWYFPGGSPASSDLENPLVTYDSSGVFDVTLIAFNDLGVDTLYLEDYILVGMGPMADFSFVVSDTSVTFTNLSGNADSLFWDFGDGETTSVADPVHHYSGDGTYDVMLIALNNCGQDTSIQQIVIVTPPFADFAADTTSGCVPLTVQFVNQSSSNADSLLWLFPGAMPASSTMENPLVTYDNAGSYDVTLIVWNEAGIDTLTFTNYININDIPEAGFTASVNGLEVVFENTSTNADNYFWSFGNGETSAAVDTTLHYSEEGTYTVMLLASNECGPDTLIQNVTLLLPPVGGFSADTLSGCAGLQVQFSDQSSGTVDSYNWNFPGGDPSTSTSADPVVTYNSPGSYDVTLVVTNTEGSDTVLFENYIFINDVPEAGFSYTADVETVEFQNESLNADSFIWYFGDNEESTEPNPVHAYTEEGTYKVSLIAFNECGADTSIQNVTVIFAPVAGASADQLTGCPGLEVQFTSEASENTESWAWSFPGGSPSASNLENPLVTYDTPGQYDVSLIVSNISGTDTLLLENYLTIQEEPAAAFDMDVSAGTVNFQNNSENAGSYIWNFGDGEESTDENPVHDYSEDGDYTVMLIATGPCGVDTIEQIVSVLLVPVAGFEVDVNSACVGTTVQFSDQSSGTVDSWAWSFPGGDPNTSDLQNPQVTYDTPGTYSVSLIVGNASGVDTLTFASYIEIAPDPEADFTADVDGASLTLSNNSFHADSFNWDFGNGEGSNEENPGISFDEDGTYTITLIASSDCGADTLEQEVTILTPPSAGFGADQTSGCPELSVQFEDQSSENTVSLSWFFPGGTPATSSDPDPLVVYEEPGQYDVVLIAENPAGSDTIAFMEYISVLSLPEPGFNTDVDGMTVDFSNLSVNANSYIWHFGDGESSTASDPVYTYMEGDTFTVELIAINDCDSISVTEEVIIIAPPVVGFKASKTNGCSPLSIQFVDLSLGEVEEWFWEFPGGNPTTSTEQSPTVVYENAGSFDVTLTVSNASGSSTVEQLGYVDVSTVPAAAFTSSVNGLEVSFDNQSQGGNVYLWDFGDEETSNEESPLHTYSEDGVYVVTLQVTNACGTTEINDTIEIITPPTALFVMEPDGFGCVPLALDLIDQSSDNTTSWVWKVAGPELFSSEEQSPSFLLTQPGEYQITLEVSNAAGGDSFIQTFVAGDTPTAGFTVTAADLELDFTNTSLDGDTFFWDFGDNETSNEESPTHEYADYGEYTIIMIASNACGDDTLSQTILLEPGVIAPVASFEASPQAGCPTLEVSFSDLSENVPTEWQWSFPGGEPESSDQPDPVVTYSEPGLYDVILIVTNLAGTDTLEWTEYIEVEDLPTADYSFTQDNGMVSFTNTSQNATSYQWDFGDNEGSQEENPEHEYTFPGGSFDVVLIATNDCGSDTLTQTVEVIFVSTQLPKFLDAFNLYPNPGDGQVFLEMSGSPRAELRIELYDMLGRRLYDGEEDFSDGRLSKQFDWRSLPAGTYVLQLQSGNDVMQWKLVFD